MWGGRGPGLGGGVWIRITWWIAYRIPVVQQLGEAAGPRAQYQGGGSGVLRNIGQGLEQHTRCTQPAHSRTMLYMGGRAGALVADRAGCRAEAGCWAGKGHF